MVPNLLSTLIGFVVTIHNIRSWLYMTIIGTVKLYLHMENKPITFNSADLSAHTDKP